MAVESALTQLFLKWKGIEFFGCTGRHPPDDEQEAWERDYRRGTSPGGFKKSADFVSRFLCGKEYDAFVTDFSAKANKTDVYTVWFPEFESQSKAQSVHQELFNKRNRIMHWGNVIYQEEDASGALAAATRAIAVLKDIDTEKYQAMEKSWRPSPGGSEGTDETQPSDQARRADNPVTKNPDD
jgi:hypothetical protein